MTSHESDPFTKIKPTIFKKVWHQQPCIFIFSEVDGKNGYRSTQRPGQMMRHRRFCDWWQMKRFRGSDQQQEGLPGRRAYRYQRTIKMCREKPKKLSDYYNVIIT